jgi:ComF family protein
VNLSLFVGSALQQGRGLGQRALASCAELLFPPGCAACDAELAAVDAVFCFECAATLQPLAQSPSCERCAHPLSEAATLRRLRLSRRVLATCEACAGWPNALESLRAPYEYGGALAEAIIASKWQARFDRLAPLSRLLQPDLEREIAGCDAVVPVPLHGERLRQRGYNQAARLALSALSTLPPEQRRPLRPSLLARLRPDPPARHLALAERRQRSQGAFAVPQGVAVCGLRLLLVDDVVTTGATLAACAEALSAAGAASVRALALARAVSSRAPGP